MEITSETAQGMIEARFGEYPELGAVAHDPEFKTKLAQILDFSAINQDLYPTIENEVLVILSLYAPLRELGQNIAEDTGLALEQAENIATLIETLILAPVQDDLEAFDYLWHKQLEEEPQVPEANKELKEELALRPEGVVAPGTIEGTGALNQKPLTREEVLKSLSAKRTMQSDITSIQKKSTEPLRGYEPLPEDEDDEK